MPPRFFKRFKRSQKPSAATTKADFDKEALAKDFVRDPYKFIQKYRVEFNKDDMILTSIRIDIEDENKNNCWFNIQEVKSYRDNNSALAPKIILQTCSEGQPGAFRVYWLPMTGRVVEKSYTLPEKADNNSLLFTPILTGCHIIFAKNKSGQTKAIHQLYEDTESKQLHDSKNPQVAHFDVINKALTENEKYPLESARGLISNNYTKNTKGTFIQTFLVGQYQDGEWQFWHQALYYTESEKSNKPFLVYSLDVNEVDKLVVTPDGQLNERTEAKEDLAASNPHGTSP